MFVWSCSCGVVLCVLFWFCNRLTEEERVCCITLFVFSILSVFDLDGAMNHGHRQTDLIIVDFAKAFDNLPQGTSIL